LRQVAEFHEIVLLQQKKEAIKYLKIENNTINNNNNQKQPCNEKKCALKGAFSKRNAYFHLKLNLI